MEINSHIRYLIVLILSCSFLICCSPQRRMNRLIKNYPELTQTDTIVVIDTVIIERYDTTVINNIIRQDSVTIINNERIKIKYFYDTITEKIEHFITLPSDSVFTETFIPVEKVIFKEISWWEKYGTLIIILSILVAILIAFKRLI